MTTPENYGLIKNYGHAGDSFNDTVTELLMVAQGPKKIEVQKQYLERGDKRGWKNHYV
jgi:hypothetical protein